jgi:hypothetical protein
MKNLIYVPLEKYLSRYTEYLSGVDGMFHQAVKDADTDVGITLVQPDDRLREIKQGVVLDTVGRAKWCFQQTTTLLEMIHDGRITSDSVIYIEDFWHPGWETLPYACDLMGIRPKVYCLLHAQSVDPHDFTYPMHYWMRDAERSWATWLTGIFCSDPALKDLVVNGGIAPAEKVHATGMIMRWRTLVDKFQPSAHQSAPTVVFASRFDKEKNPEFFLELAYRGIRYDDIIPEDVQFVICSGRPIGDEWNRRAKQAGVLVLDHLSKTEYLSTLAGAQVLFNCADQDFVSYAVLDGLAMGCQPLLPEYLTFPGVVHYDDDYLYCKGDMESALAHLSRLFREPRKPYVHGDPMPELYKRFGSKYEHSVRRMLQIMFPLIETLEEEIERGCREIVK